MEKSITELLVRPQIAFETIPGHYTGETKFRTGLCDTHKRSVAASNHVEDYNVTLSNVAVLFDYVKDGQLSCAGSSDRVYLEFRDKGGNTVWCYAEMWIRDRQKITRISFQKKKGPSIISMMRPESTA